MKLLRAIQDRRNERRLARAVLFDANLGPLVYSVPYSGTAPEILARECLRVGNIRAELDTFLDRHEGALREMPRFGMGRDQRDRRVAVSVADRLWGDLSDHLDDTIIALARACWAQRLETQPTEEQRGAAIQNLDGERERTQRLLSSLEELIRELKLGREPDGLAALASELERHNARLAATYSESQVAFPEVELAAAEPIDLADLRSCLGLPTDDGLARDSLITAADEVADELEADVDRLAGDADRLEDQAPQLEAFHLDETLERELSRLLRLSGVWEPDGLIERLRALSAENASPESHWRSGLGATDKLALSIFGTALGVGATPAQALTLTAAVKGAGLLGPRLVNLLAR